MALVGIGMEGGGGRVRGAMWDVGGRWRVGGLEEMEGIRGRLLGNWMDVWR